MTTGRPPAWRRRAVLVGVAFRIAALLLGCLLLVLPLALLEIVFRIADWGRPGDHPDPFVGFEGSSPLFVPNDDGTHFEIAPGRHAFFCPDSFAAEKAPTEFRIFCLGGSTVQGRPFSTETSFPRWLELSLQAAVADERKVEVVNCGGISYASYRLVRVLEEVLGHSPDLIVVCTGHNEFLEDRTYDPIKRMPVIVAGPLELCSRLRTFRVLREAVLQLTASSPAADDDRPVLAERVDARLDHRGGLDQYHRDESWRREVIAHYRHSLKRMVAMCRDAGVPLILVHPVSNLRDCPPFKSEHRDTLTAEELERWSSLVKQARSHYATDRRRALELLRAALEIDEQYAATHYEIGRCLDSLGRFREAHEAYRRARDLDICTLRILSPMSADLIALARRSETPLVDLEELFGRLSDEGIPGNDWLLDHVHPSIRGHQEIAHALAEAIFARELIEPPDAGWKERRKQLFDAHHASLDDLYFAQGVSRLEAVRRWARGQVEEE